jgi:secreted trypsin-like serine protease
VGGQNATQSWTVSLQSLGPNGALHECGGVLIASKWVLTAAHCAPFVTGQARIGSLNWKQASPATSELISVSQVFSNPKHDSSKGFGNDIALVKLAKDAKSQTIPIGLYGAVGSTGITQGWGITCDLDVTAPGCGDQKPDWLQQLSMRRTTDHFCDLVNSSGVQLNDPITMMCVVTADGSHAGTCFGDSGSPYLETIRGVKAVTGIMISLMNNTVPSPHVCSQTPDGGPNRDGATKVKPMLP